MWVNVDKPWRMWSCRRICPFTPCLANKMIHNFYIWRQTPHSLISLLGSPRNYDLTWIPLTPMSSFIESPGHKTIPIQPLHQLCGAASGLQVGGASYLANMPHSLHDWFCPASSRFPTSTGVHASLASLGLQLSNRDHFSTDNSPWNHGIYRRH